MIKSGVPSVQLNPTLAVRRRRDEVSDAVRRAQTPVVGGTGVRATAAD